MTESQVEMTESQDSVLIEPLNNLRNLMEVLKDFMELKDLDLNQPCNPDFFKFIGTMRAIICTQFIRKSIDENFTGYEIPHHWKKAVKKELRLHGDLISQVWQLTDIAFKTSHQYYPEILYRMLVESSLVFFNTFDENTEEFKLTATAIIKDQQAKNRKLQSLENPFDKDLQPITWGFVDVCSTISQTVPSTRTDYQMMIDTRMTLVNLMLQNQPRLANQQLIIAEKRGRKKS